MNAVHVRFQAGSESYALPVTVVREVGILGDIARLPGTPPAVLGVYNLHGQVVPVIDLAGVLGASRGVPAEKMVIAEHGGGLAALAVQGITGVEAVGVASEHTDSPHLSGAALVDGVLVGVIDLEAVFDSLAPERAP